MNITSGTILTNDDGQIIAHWQRPLTDDEIKQIESGISPYYVAHNDLITFFVTPATTGNVKINTHWTAV